MEREGVGVGVGVLPRSGGELGYLLFQCLLTSLKLILRRKDFLKKKKIVLL